MTQWAGVGRHERLARVHQLSARKALGCARRTLGTRRWSTRRTGNPASPAANHHLRCHGHRTPDVHVGQPVWAAEGGAELLITNMAATAVSLTSPSAFSVDRAFDIRMPKSVVSLAVLGVAVRAVVAEWLQRSAPRAE